jgi:hypothetical protein
LPIRLRGVLRFEGLARGYGAVRVPIQACSAVGQPMVLGEMSDEDCGLVEQLRVGVFASERGEWRMDRRLGGSDAGPTG